MSTATNTATVKTTTDGKLPTPEERPTADVVIYDGQCRFCLKQVRKLLWWDCQNKLSYISLHDPEVARRYPQLTHEMMMKQMYVVDQQGHAHGGADALRYLSRRLRRMWWFAPLLHIPGLMPFWRWLYRQVADRRYQLAGKQESCDGGTCSLHGPK